MPVFLSLRMVLDDASWTVRLADDGVTVDRDPAADVTLTADRATADAIRSGDLATQDAFASGRLRVGGDLTKLLAHADALRAVGDISALLRAEGVH